MKWEGNRQSSNVEDRRGFGGFGGRGIGIGTLLAALIGGMLFGIDPLTMLSMMAGNGSGVRQEQSGYARSSLRPRLRPGTSVRLSYPPF